MVFYIGYSFKEPGLHLINSLYYFWTQFHCFMLWSSLFLCYTSFDLDVLIFLSRSFRYTIKLFIWAHFVFISWSTTRNFPPRTAFISYHTFWNVVLILLFDSRRCLTSFLTSSVTHWLLKSVLFHSHVIA